MSRAGPRCAGRLLHVLIWESSPHCQVYNLWLTCLGQTPGVLVDDYTCLFEIHHHRFPYITLVWPVLGRPDMLVDDHTWLYKIHYPTFPVYNLPGLSRTGPRCAGRWLDVPIWNTPPPFPIYNSFLTCLEQATGVLVDDYTCLYESHHPSVPVYNVCLTCLAQAKGALVDDYSAYMKVTTPFPRI